VSQEDAPSHPTTHGEALVATAADKRHAPATLRNRDPILSVLRQALPTGGEERPLVLEIASGTGEHAVHFAAGLPHLDWQPSEPDPDLRASVAAHVAEAGLANLRPPLALEVTRTPWPLAEAGAVVCINMLHIAPWACTPALLDGAAAVLPPDGPLIVYGPFVRTEVPTAASNAAFDRALRAQNPAWGLRSLESVAETAGARGLELEAVHEMPANNLTLVFRRRRA
jgi:SAM-dependent methyltransferase